MVTGILWSSVVAIMKMTCAGGSSNVFKSALNASFVSICTSSIIKIRYLPLLGGYFTVSRKLLISSIPRFDAPSNSWTSRLLPWVISWQFVHLLQGLLSWGFEQFNAFEKIRAVVVLPTPLNPENKKPCATRSFWIEFFNYILLSLMIFHSFRYYMIWFKLV